MNLRRKGMVAAKSHLRKAQIVSHTRFLDLVLILPHKLARERWFSCRCRPQKSRAAELCCLNIMPCSRKFAKRKRGRNVYRVDFAKTRPGALYHSHVLYALLEWVLNNRTRFGRTNTDGKWDVLSFLTVEAFWRGGRYSQFGIRIFRSLAGSGFWNSLLFLEGRDHLAEMTTHLEFISPVGSLLTKHKLVLPILYTYIFYRRRTSIWGLILFVHIWVRGVREKRPCQRHRI